MKNLVAILAIILLCTTVSLAGNGGGANSPSAIANITMSVKGVDLTWTDIQGAAIPNNMQTIDLGAFNQGETKDGLTASATFVLHGGKGWTVDLSFTLGTSTEFTILEATGTLTDQNGTNTGTVLGTLTPFPATLTNADGKATYTLTITKAKADDLATFGAHALQFSGTAAYN